MGDIPTVACVNPVVHKLTHGHWTNAPGHGRDVGRLGAGHGEVHVADDLPLAAGRDTCTGKGG